MTTFAPIDLQVFPKEREERLKAIMRYSIFDTMLYRSSVWDHAHRVSWLAEMIGTILHPVLPHDTNLARTIAMVHDDAEMVTGDVQAGHKAQMSPAELAELDKKEEEAFLALAKRYPKEVNGYNYKDMLIAALKKDSVEAQIVEYADKLDSYCECIHDLLGGNISILTGLIYNVRGSVLVEKKTPLLVEALGRVKHPFIRPFIYTPPAETPITVAQYETFSGKPHTEESIELETERFPFYDAWKKLVIEKGAKDWLITQREYLPV
ncbi:HD domain-containing protein [Candidatus Parcubacteria bacterium]|nr:HD domain-containing protein [Candidatus Parcubacteria bacterium]